MHKDTMNATWKAISSNVMLASSNILSNWKIGQRGSVWGS